MTTTDNASKASPTRTKSTLRNAFKKSTPPSSSLTRKDTEVVVVQEAPEAMEDSEVEITMPLMVAQAALEVQVASDKEASNSYCKLASKTRPTLTK